MYYCKYWANLTFFSTMDGQFKFKLTYRQHRHKQPVAPTVGPLVPLLMRWKSECKRWLFESLLPQFYHHYVCC
jgi:hypothetical protein